MPIGPHHAQATAHASACGQVLFSSTAARDLSTGSLLSLPFWTLYHHLDCSVCLSDPCLVKGGLSFRFNGLSFYITKAFRSSHNQPYQLCAKTPTTPPSPRLYLRFSRS